MYFHHMYEYGAQLSPVKKIDGPPQTRAFGGVGRKTKSYKYDIGLSTTGWVSVLYGIN